MTRCPICRKPASERHTPFCSTRCADVDLGRWLTGQYVVAGREHEETTDDTQADQT